MGFGKLFKQQDTLTSLSNSMAVNSGEAQRRAADTQAAALKTEGDLAFTQAAQEAALTRREIDIAAGNQAQQYLSAGVNLIGTPMQVINSARALGQMKLDALDQRGRLEQELNYARAGITENAGAQAYLTGQGQTLVNELTNEINKEQTERNYYRGAYGGLAQGGLSILKPVAKAYGPALFSKFKSLFQ